MAEIQEIWESILQFFRNDYRNFNFFVLLLPTAMILFLVYFFRVYSRDMKPRAGTLEWIPELSRPKFSLLEKRGRVNERDWLFILLLTMIYGLLAFSISGDATAPQTFWQASGDERIATLDLGAEYRLDTLMYYTGLFDGTWKLELSADGQEWREQGYWKTDDNGEQAWESGMTQYWRDLFKWRYAQLEAADDALLTRYIRISPSKDGMELGELVLVTRDEDGTRKLFPDMASLTERHPRLIRMFDEQGLFPSSPNQNNSSYFDEIYHARTAYEYVRNASPTETTHPPLGKGIISLGIQLFGMTPFGWRFMGILFGVLMIPFFYILAKNIFDHTVVAACGTALFAFENMHYAQTHLATIDTFVVFFILCMYLFMYRFITSGYDAPFYKVLPSLFLCGLSFGLGAASKWTGFYAALGLVVMYVVYLVARGRYQAQMGQSKEYLVFLFWTLAASVLFFVAIPAVIYTLSYIPYATANGNTLTFDGLVDAMWKNQDLMLKYHGLSVLGADHPYKSRWWMWMLDIRPILYYSNYDSGNQAKTLIAGFTNPMVSIGGLVAMVYALLDFFRRKSAVALFIIIGFLAQLVPWMLVSRITFAYHYFPSMVFLALALCYVFSNILRRYPQHTWRVGLFTGISLLIFFILFPPTAGVKMPNWYFTYFVKWLPSWPF